MVSVQKKGPTPFEVTPLESLTRRVLFVDLRGKKACHKYERSGFSIPYRNDDEIAAMEELRQGLELYLEPDQILPLSAYKLQASRFRRSMCVQAAQGMQASIVVYGITTYGSGKKSVNPFILNVVLTRAIDLFLVLGDRNKTIQNTDRKTELQSKKTVRNMRALLGYSIPFDRFMTLLRSNEIQLINDSVQFYLPAESSHCHHQKRRKTTK